MIYNVNLSENFADKLAEYVLSKKIDDPFEMARLQIILPTRRACRTVKEAFLRASQERTLLLPKLTPLYELDDLQIDLPPKMPNIQRIMLLAKLCLAKPNISTPDKAVIVAFGLASLLDEFYQHEADMGKLADLVQEKQFAEHWMETVEFLDIIHDAWPKILNEFGQIDEMDYTIRMIKATTKNWEQNPPEHPIIMAGFDGSIPAVIELAKVVNNLKNGDLFFNGVDTTIKTQEFKKLPDNHYQYAFKKLLEALHTQPEKLTTLSPRCSCEHLLSEAFKPAAQTNTWQFIDSFDKETLKNVTLFECETMNEEALTVALILRQTLETPAKTAAFVTTDRMLARRVIVEMKRWGVELDDSAGTPLYQTEIGVYLLLMTEMAQLGGSGSAKLALLKHPLSADKMNPSAFRVKVKAAEFDARLKNHRLDIQTQTDFTPFIARFQNNILVPFKTLLQEHIALAESLATSHDRTGIERLWNNDAGQDAYKLITELLEYGDILGEIEPAFYPALLKLFMSNTSVRPRYGMHPRLDILGPIEARMSQADIMIVGGLNEGSFPQIPETGPWLNRPMRKSLNLPSLESKIATAAMDFAHCLCAKEVYLTRSLKADGSPTIPSRFLSRLEAVLKAGNIIWEKHRPQLARLIDKPTESKPAVRPAPKPPLSARPRSLSVTKIELWMRDPYAIYARYILKLYPLDNLEALQKGLLFGNAAHKALERFIKQNPASLDEKKLLAFGMDIFKSCGFDEGDLAFYMPKFENIAKWFLSQQAARQGLATQSIVEQKGEIVLSLPHGPFKLSGTADRIDILKDGSVQIIDYKTGTVPSVKEVHAGFAPQLPLEAYILTQGGFENVQSREVADLSYWKLSGKTNGSKITSLLGKNDKNLDSLIIKSAEGVKALIHTFDDENTPYESCPVPEKAPKYNDYEHLSRAKEWLNADDDEDEDYE